MDFKMAAVLLLIVGVELSSASLKGKLVSCDKEGHVMNPPPGADRCIKCECRDKSVQCWKPKCAESEGCHVLSLHKPKHSCCHTCRGCFHEGRELLNGESYESSDAARLYTCKASVVTVSTTRCHSPCAQPVHVPGHYCPLCPADDSTAKGGCFHDNQFVANGDRVNWRGSKCTECTCVNGQLSCAKRACPVLNCPESKIVHDESSCCPKCQGSHQQDYPTNGNCVFRGKLLQDGASSNPDKCTKCQCKIGSTVCHREICPILQCPSHAVIHEKGDCCPKCREAQACAVEDGTRREHNEEWKMDSCTKCLCYAGTVKCQTATCDESKPCPANLIKTKMAGQCCSVCVQPDARCTIDGSGSESLRFTTFDRKHFKYDGVCKYTLAKDDINDTFSIRVQNGYKTPSTVAVKLLQILIKTPDNSVVTVTMDTRMVAKVNKTVVKSGGYKMADVFILEKSKDLIMSLTLLESKVKVILSADGYVEVVASRDWQEKLSGLCGDYNELAADDMTSRDGHVYTETDKFAESWRVGGRCSCDKKVPESERHSACSNNPQRRLIARQRCDVIRGNAFKQCSKVFNVRPYYLTCLDNVCSCEKEPANGDCECPIVTMLQKECQKLGVRVGHTSCNPKPQRKLEHEARFLDSSPARNTGRPSKKSRKSRKSKKSRKNAKKSRKEKVVNDQSYDIEKLKAELTKKHAKRQEVKKPRGPDDFLFG